MLMSHAAATLTKDVGKDKKLKELARARKEEERREVMKEKEKQRREEAKQTLMKKFEEEKRKRQEGQQAYVPQEATIRQLLRSQNVSRYYIYLPDHDEFFS